MDAEFEVGEVIDKWMIPPVYNDWKISEKRKLAAECLNVNCSQYAGTKIADFKSKIIKDYLDKTT